MLLLITTEERGILTVGTIFTDDYRIALVHKLLFHLHHLIGDMLVGIHVLIIIPDGVYGSTLVIGRRMFFPIKSHLAPIGIFVHQGKYIRIVEMNLCHQAVLHLILQTGNVIRILGSQINLGLWSLYDEHTAGIITTGSTDGIDKHLFVSQETVGKLLAFGSQHITLNLRTGTSHSRFVEGSKENPLVIRLEFLCYIRPQLAEHLLMLCHIRPTGKGIMLHPSAIPVFVDDDTETGIETIVHDFLDSFHPDRIDAHISLSVR